MKCSDVNMRMLIYLDGELSLPEREAFEKHLTECSVCNLELNQLKAIYSSVELEKQQFVFNQSFSEGVIAKIGKAENVSPESSSYIRYLVVTSLAAAAIFAGIIIGTLVSKSGIMNSSTQDSWEQLAEEYMPEYDSNPYQFTNENNQQ